MNMTPEAKRLKESLLSLLRAMGYEDEEEREGCCVLTKKKKVIGFLLLPEWEEEAIQEAIERLVKLKGKGSFDYLALVGPKATLHPEEGVEPLKVFARHLNSLLDNQLNLWGFDEEKGSVFLMVGSLPTFDFKLLSKLMEGKGLMAAGAQKMIETKGRQLLIKGFHTLEEFKEYIREPKE